MEYEMRVIACRMSVMQKGASEVQTGDSQVCPHDTRGRSNEGSSFVIALQLTTNKNMQMTGTGHQPMMKWWPVIAANNCNLVSSHLLPRLMDAYSGLLKADGIEQVRQCLGR